MRVSNRLLRVIAAFAVVGFVAAQVPSTGIMVAFAQGGGNPPPGPEGNPNQDKYKKKKKKNTGRDLVMAGGGLAALLLLLGAGGVIDVPEAKYGGGAGLSKHGFYGANPTDDGDNPEGKLSARP